LMSYGQQGKRVLLIRGGNVSEESLGFKCRRIA
jgi:hypothetical protein